MRVKLFQRKFKRGTGSLGSAVGIIAFLLIVSLTILLLPINSGAKEWPTKPITIIVPWVAGAGSDLTTRILAEKMSKILDVPVQVVNKPGGSGIIGTLEAVKSTPDGYTLLHECGSTSSVQYALSKDLPYKIEERIYISRAFYLPFALMVPASSPWKTVEDLVNAIRTNPSSISYGLIGGTGMTDVVILQFQAALKAKRVDVSKTRPVTYRGTGEVTPAVAGGHLSFGVAGPPSTTPLVSAGKIRPLAVTSEVRYKGWPNVPTTAEVGFPSVNYICWYGLSGPPGLPANVVKILDNAVKETVNAPDVIPKMDKIGISPAYQPSDAFRKFVFEEGELIKSLKLK